MSGSRSVLSPEARLLLASADIASPRDPSRLLEPDLDWRRLYRLIRRERAAGPVWRFLEPVRHQLAGGFSRRLKRAAAVEGLRQQQLLEKVEASVEALNAAGVTPLLLKGAALVLTCYDDVRQRPMADIDLLVRPDEAERAREALLDSGWDRDRETYPAEMYGRHYHQPPVEDAGGSGIELELHTGLLVPGHPFAFGPGDLWRRAREVGCGAGTALVPDRRDHLLYVCLHFAWGHTLGSAGWRTFRDVGVLTAAGAFPWQEFLESAGDARAEPAAYWTLRLARELARVEVPACVLDALSPKLPAALVGRLASHYALELFGDDGGCPSVRMGQLMWLAGNEWGYRQDGPRARKRAIRPWEYSGDFEPMQTGDGAADTGAAKLRRHLAEGGRWADYLRRVLFSVGGRDEARG